MVLLGEKKEETEVCNNSQKWLLSRFYLQIFPFLKNGGRTTLAGGQAQISRPNWARSRLYSMHWYVLSAILCLSHRNC